MSFHNNEKLGGSGKQGQTDVKVKILIKMEVITELYVFKVNSVNY